MRTSDRAEARRLLAQAMRDAGMVGQAMSVDRGRLSRLASAAVAAIEETMNADRVVVHPAVRLADALRRHDMPFVPTGPSRYRHPVVTAALVAMERIEAEAPKGLAPAALSDNHLGRDSAGGVRMAAIRPTITVNNGQGVCDMERTLADMVDRRRTQEFVLKASGTAQPPFLRDMWLSMIVDAAFEVADTVTLLAPGAIAWPDFGAEVVDDDTPALSLAYLLAAHRHARILPERAPEEPLPASAVRRFVSQRRGGLLGQGGRWRRLVEFDPDDSIASVIGRGDDGPARVERLILRLMAMFEVGAIARRHAPVAMGPRRHVIDFLRELHVNAYRYARRAGSVRMLGFRKHLYDQGVALARAERFPDLHAFVEAQASGMINLVECTVSDFGPGILEGFRRSEAGIAYAGWDDARLVDAIVHQQLSSNLDDPSAGLGTVIALEAASKVGGFVTLRTGAHWFVMDPNRADGPRMSAVPGSHPAVTGTHWAILYPDAPLA